MQLAAAHWSFMQLADYSFFFFIINNSCNFVVLTYEIIHHWLLGKNQFSREVVAIILRILSLIDFLHHVIFFIHLSIFWGLSVHVTFTDTNNQLLLTINNYPWLYGCEPVSVRSAECCSVIWSFVCLSPIASCHSVSTITILETNL